MPTRALLPLAIILSVSTVALYIPKPTSGEMNVAHEWTLNHFGFDLSKLPFSFQYADFKPISKKMTSNQEFKFGSTYELSSGQKMPFFNLEYDNQGIIAAVGYFNEANFAKKLNGWIFKDFPNFVIAKT